MATDGPSRPDPGRFPERELIPYEASVFESARALVLAPHADDEVFGCGAALASLRDRGIPVHVWVASDGAGDEPDRESRRKIEELRAAESVRALSELGGAALHRGGFPDRGLLERVGELADALTLLLARIGPDLVFAPSPVEVHPDHRGVAEALLAVGRRPATDPGAVVLSQARIAFYEISQPIRPNFLLDATPFRERKDRAMEAYASQISGKPYPDLVRGLNSYRRMTLGPDATAAEAYFVLPGNLLGALPAGRLCAVLGPSVPPGRLFEPAASEASSSWRRLLGLLSRQGSGARRSE